VLHLPVRYTVWSVVALLSGAVVCACATAVDEMPVEDDPGIQQRVLAVVADPAKLRDPAQLAAEIKARTGVRATVGTPVSERIVPITLDCPRGESQCATALRAL
jgi:hypothetical protein